MNTLSVVTPTINEEEKVGDILSQMCSIEPGFSKVGIRKLQFIKRDHGSGHCAGEIVSELAGIVELADHEVNGLLFGGGDATDLPRQLQTFGRRPGASIWVLGCASVR